MKALYLPLLYCLLVPFLSWGQQLVHYSQYMFQGALKNPSALNKSGYTEVGAFHRQQWQGVPGAPVSTGVMFQAPILRDEYMLTGAVQHSKFGPYQHTRGGVGLSYRTFISRRSSFWGNTILSGGAQIGLASHQLNLEELILLDGFSHDLALLRLATLGYCFDVGIGATLINEKWQFGLALQQLALPLGVDDRRAQGSLSPHYFVFGSIDVIPGKEPLAVRPGIFMKHGYRWSPIREVGSRVPPSITANVTVEYYPGKYDRHHKNQPFQTWAGLSATNEESVGAFLGFGFHLFKNQAWDQWLKLGYAFDLFTHSLAPFAHNTHEVMLLFQFRTLNAIDCFNASRNVSLPIN